MEGLFVTLSEGTDRRVNVAIPTSGRVGPEGRCSVDFGRATYFAIFEIVDHEIDDSWFIDNPESETDQCMKAIGALKKEGVDTILVGEIGKLGFRICNDLGIALMREIREGETVQDALERFLEDRMEPVLEEPVDD